MGQKMSFNSVMANIYIFIYTYHSGTVDSSCWWCLSSQPKFLHVSKLEWALYMTHTLLRQKTQITNTVHSFVAVIHGSVKEGAIVGFQFPVTYEPKKNLPQR